MKPIQSNILLYVSISVIMVCLHACKTSSAYLKDLAQQRKEYSQSFIDNPRSPLQEEDTMHLRFYPITKKWKIKAEFTKSLDTTTLQIPTYSGIYKPYQIYGSLRFTVENKMHTLQVYYSPTYRNHPLYKNHLFLPFKDLTNGEETYGGGRYLDLSVEDIQKNQTVILDFNQCYNPWCAYSDGYNCPVPPKSNHLSLSILAGEKKYAGAYKYK